MVADISFFVEGDVNHPFAENEDMYVQWLINVANTENKKIIKLTYIFCSDEYLLDMNIKHLGHDYYTDIITFPYVEGDHIESDLFISIERVRENAEEFNVTFENELRRVMVHGVLHLFGYGDKTEAECRIMREKEDIYIF